MKFLRVLLSAVITGTICYIVVAAVSSFFWDSEPGSMDDLAFLLFSFPIFVLGTIILIFIFFFLENRINVTGIIFSGIVGVLLVNVLNIILGFFSAPSGSNLHMLMAIYNDYQIFLNVLLLPLGYIFINKSTKWLHIDGFLLGSILGFLISYGGVILYRWFDNTLTSYFYFSDKETSFVILLVLAGSIIGNIVGIKRK
jgi:hypothetical protein